VASGGGTRQRRWRQEALASDPYHFLHNRLSSGSAPLRRVRLSLDELDDIVAIELALPEGDSLVSVEARRDGKLLLPVLTDIEQTTADGGHGDAYALADVDAAVAQTEPVAETTIRAKLWNSVKWEQGMSPYNRADWSLTFGFKAPDARTVLTLDLPGAYGPASLQGNHLLAHPSQRDGPRRLVRLLYGPGRGVTTNGRITKTAASPDTWTSLAKGALLLAFGAVLSLFSRRALAGQQAQLLLTAVAGLGAFGATELGLLESSVYLTSARPLRLLQASSVVLSVGLFAWISIELFLANVVSPVTRDILSAVAGVEMAVAIVGILLHRRGYWSGYQCDICREPIGLRRGHNECYVTGRVPCQADVERLCSHCPHFPDLGVQNLTTIERYDSSLLPCVARAGDGAGQETAAT
jgi:hypothetical protein